MSALVVRRCRTRLEAADAARGPRRGAADGRPATTARSSTPLPRPARHLRAGDLLVVNASATIPAALPARRADGTALDLHLSTPDPSARRAAGSSSCAATARASRGDRPSARRCPRAARSSCSRRTSRPGRLWVAALDLPRPLRRVPRRPRRADPLRPRPDAAPARATTRRSSPPSPAARRCRAPAARSPSARSTSAPRARRQRPADRAAHRRQLAGARRAPVPRALPRPRPHRRPRQRRARRGHRVIAVGTTVVRALETVADARRPRPRRRGWTSLIDHARARRPRRRRAASPAGTSPTRATC